jgi:hypothetical protein
VTFTIESGRSVIALALATLVAAIAGVATNTAANSVHSAARFKFPCLVPTSPH